MEGQVYLFDDLRGFGWIDSKDQSKRVFVHFSDIDAAGFRSLNPGEKVTFDVEENERGLRAKNVSRITA